ncbi:MAG: hypothetical protein COS94_10480 [Candidatus Hydrogenedentes bacterium CG07_land_8_20_14_0_80_42_17]|nr:MAG: hypothetical protein COS94_10480 [Candidatus Hydrogenedentes bacterium CG07_land_8_20_14_0_80_42_17]
MKKMIDIYVDASCYRNPGPGGVGIVVNHNGSWEERCEISIEDTTTSSKLELMAIIEAFNLIRKRKYKAREVLIHSDSQYALGIVEGVFLPKKNIELCNKLQDLACIFPEVKYKHIRGEENPADIYARKASMKAAIKLGLIFLDKANEL